MINENQVLMRINKYLKYEDCWIWKGAMSRNNAVISINQKTYSVKRLLIKIYFPGFCLKGYLKSSCNNRLCVNPSHAVNREKFFDSLISKCSKSGCWLWLGTVKNNYPYFSINRKDEAVHRLMYKKHVGEIPDGKSVCHKCDAPLCVNPDHLWVGSHSDNMKDMIKKKRGNKNYGENHHNCKITENQAVEIKKYLKKAFKMTEIQKLMNVSYKTIQHIKHGTSWSHI